MDEVCNITGIYDTNMETVLVKTSAVTVISIFAIYFCTDEELKTRNFPRETLLIRFEQGWVYFRGLSFVVI